MYFVLRYLTRYGEKPFLGWQSWCAVGKCGTDLCTDAQIRSTAKALVDNGMKDAGFEWVVLDDCEWLLWFGLACAHTSSPRAAHHHSAYMDAGWHPSRDNKTAELIPYKKYFPNGIKPVVDYVHSLGLVSGTELRSNLFIHRVHVVPS